jgi:PST family polysaccharide transporter/lipopolysaccharide exporter
LGSNWIDIIPSLKILSIFGIIRSLSTTTGPLIKSQNKPHVMTTYGLIRLVMLAILIFPLSQKAGIVGASWAVVISSLIPQPYLFYQIKKIIK